MTPQHARHLTSGILHTRHVTRSGRMTRRFLGRHLVTSCCACADPGRGVGGGVYHGAEAGGLSRLVVRPVC